MPKEKELWAKTASEAFKIATNCDQKEADGVRVGWMFGFDAARTRIDHKLDYLQKMLHQHNAFSGVDLVKDIRENIRLYGEKEG
jgi:hypothetical protein